VKFSLKQVLTIAAAMLLGVGIYFAPRKISVLFQEKTANEEEFLQLVESEKNSLQPNQSAELQRLKKQRQFDSLAYWCVIWNRPASAAFYKKEKAVSQNSVNNWNDAGEFFYKAAQFAAEKDKRVLYQSAVECYRKSLAIDSTSLITKTNLGICTVESSHILGTPPMTGIQMLLDVVKKDPSNIEAQLNLGIFSVNSQQFEKAIERFQKVLNIDSGYYAVHIAIGDAYLKMGDLEKAVTSYEKYKANVKDSVIVKDMEQKIQRINNKKL
jgi:tetratricopeptide (TPR) repeat protein